jgi:hypothetical protein
MSSFITYKKNGGRVISSSFDPYITDLTPYEDADTAAMFVDEQVDVFSSKVVNGVILPIADTDFPEEQLAAVKRELKEQSWVKLNNSDWTQLNDVSLTAQEIASWKVYRQDLRNMSKKTDNQLRNVKRARDLIWPLAP